MAAPPPSAPAPVRSQGRSSPAATAASMQARRSAQLDTLVALTRAVHASETVVVAMAVVVAVPVEAAASEGREKKRPGEPKSSVHTMKTGLHTARKGLRRPQRVRVASESLPTTNPSRKSADLHSEMIMACAAIVMPRASR